MIHSTIVPLFRKESLKLMWVGVILVRMIKAMRIIFDKKSTVEWDVDG
jgi:hypothetical protein